MIKIRRGVITAILCLAGACCMLPAEASGISQAVQKAVQQQKQQQQQQQQQQAATNPSLSQLNAYQGQQLNADQTAWVQAQLSSAGNTIQDITNNIDYWTPSSPNYAALQAQMQTARQIAGAADAVMKNQQKVIDPAQAQANACAAEGIAAMFGGSGGVSQQCQTANQPSLLGDPNASTASSPTFIDVTYILQHIQAQVPNLVRFIVALSYVSGIAFFLMALMKLKQKGMQTVMSASSHDGMKGPIIYFFVGCALLYFPTFINVGTNTLMGPGGGDNLYGYGAAAASSFGYADLVVTIVAIVRLVGYIAFLRGWFLLAKMGGHSAQPGQASKGVVHIIGGILAVNILTTYQIVKATLGLVF